MSMNKVVSQGHLVLTAGADGFAKIWVSTGKNYLQACTHMKLRRIMLVMEFSGSTAIFEQDCSRTRSTSSSYRLPDFRAARRRLYSLLSLIPTRARDRFDLPVRPKDEFEKYRANDGSTSEQGGDGARLEGGGRGGWQFRKWRVASKCRS